MRRMWLVVSLTVLASGLTALAWGDEFSRGRFGGRGGYRGGHPDVRPRSALERVIFPCRAGCVDADRTCASTAESAGEMCITASCGAELAAAQAACQADRTSTDCQTAANALWDCAASCLDTEAAALSTCHTTRASCLTTCGNT